MADLATSIPALDPGERLLCGPGPSNVHPDVLESMRLPMNGHLDPDFWDILVDLVSGLQALWRSSHGLSICLSSSGTSAMEAGFMNLIEPGDTVISCHWGFFGSRLNDFAHRVGAEVVELTADFGQLVPVDRIMETLAANPDSEDRGGRACRDVHRCGVPAAGACRGDAGKRLGCAALRRLRDLARRPTRSTPTHGASTTDTPARRRRWGVRPGSRRSRSAIARSK